MIPFFFRRLIPFACAAALLHPAAAQQPAAKQKINLPPSAELLYAINAKQNGMGFDGDATVRWVNGGNKFTVSSEARAMVVGKILDARSEGAVDAFGLAPQSFSEKRFRKEKVTTSFDRGARLIRFSKSPETYPLTGGEQDRTSAIWQLISMARGAPAKVKTGAEWRFVVAGQRDAEPWTFKVVKREKLGTSVGELNAVHIVRMPQPGSKDQQLDIWLAPTLEWYPVRLRFSDANGDFIEQTLKQVNRSAS